MSEHLDPDFYTVSHAPLCELLDMARTAPVKAELEKRAICELEKVFVLYRDVFGDNAAERFSEDAASLFAGRLGP